MTAPAGRRQEDEVNTVSHGPTARPLTGKGEARRARLLDAAAQSLLEHGYAQTSIQRVLQQAGGSAATAYQLFGNKEGLLAAVLQHELDGLRAAVFPDTVLEPPVDTALHELAVRLLDYALQPGPWPCIACWYRNAIACRNWPKRCGRPWKPRSTRRSNTACAMPANAASCASTIRAAPRSRWAT